MLGDFRSVEINSAAQQAQIHAGVDPDLCISIEEWPWGNRTPLRDYARRLSEHAFVVPAFIQPRTNGRDPWRVHDGDVHVRRVGALHPDLGDLAICGALQVLDYCEEGDTEAAESIGTYLDYFLANKPLLWREALSDLVAVRNGVYPLEARKYEHLSRDEQQALISTQVEHFAWLTEYPNHPFVAVNIDEGLV